MPMAINASNLTSSQQIYECFGDHWQWYKSIQAAVALWFGDRWLSDVT